MLVLASSWALGTRVTWTCWSWTATCPVQPHGHLGPLHSALCAGRASAVREMPTLRLEFFRGVVTVFFTHADVDSVACLVPIWVKVVSILSHSHPTTLGGSGAVARIAGANGCL